MRTRFGFLVLVVVVTISALPRRAGAQSSRSRSSGSAEQPAAEAPPPVDEATRTRARELYMQGVDHWNNQRAEPARQAFQEAYDLVHEPSILFNLGSAQVETGHLIEGRDSYRLFLERVTSGPAARHRREAQRMLQQVQARIPTIKLQIADLAEGDEVFLDARPLAAAELAEPLEVAPSEHTVVVRRGGREWAHEMVTVAEREQKTEQVALVEPPTVPTPEETARAAAIDEHQDQRTPAERRRRRIIIGSSVAGGVAVIATILAVVLATR